MPVWLAGLTLLASRSGPTGRFVVAAARRSQVSSRVAAVSWPGAMSNRRRLRRQSGHRSLGRWVSPNNLLGLPRSWRAGRRRYMTLRTWSPRFRTEVWAYAEAIANKGRVAHGISWEG